MRYRPKQSSRLRIVLCFFSILLVGGATLGNDVGRCLSADIPSPIVLPKGDVVPAGKLTICNRVAYSPVASLEEISINGRSLGMFISRSTESARVKKIAGERRDDHPVLIFFRNDRGELELFSYHRPMGERMLHHVFGTQGKLKVDSYWKVASKDAVGKKKKNKHKAFDLSAVMEDVNVVIVSAVGP